MARQRPETMPESTPPAARTALPMQLQLGDRLTDETGEWEIIGRPYTPNGGKDSHARVQKVGQPDVTEIRTWGARERVTIGKVSHSHEE